MLIKDKDQRISAKEAFDDIWLKSMVTQIPLDSSVLTNLQSFTAQNKLREAILSFIVSRLLTQEEKN